MQPVPAEFRGKILRHKVPKPLLRRVLPRSGATLCSVLFGLWSPNLVPAPLTPA